MEEGEVEHLEAKHWPDAQEGDPDKTYKVGAGVVWTRGLGVKDDPHTHLHNI